MTPGHPPAISQIAIFMPIPARHNKLQGSKRHNLNEVGMDICTHCGYAIPAPGVRARVRFYGRAGLPPGWLCCSQKRGRRVNPVSTTQTNIHPHSLLSFGLVTLVSTKGEKHRHTSNQHKRHQKQNRGSKKPCTQHPTGYHHNTRNKLTQIAKTPKIPHYTIIRTYREQKQGGGSSHPSRTP